MQKISKQFKLMVMLAVACITLSLTSCGGPNNYEIELKDYPDEIVGDWKETVWGYNDANERVKRQISYVFTENNVYEYSRKLIRMTDDAVLSAESGTGSYVVAGNLVKLNGTYENGEEMVLTKQIYALNHLALVIGDVWNGSEAKLVTTDCVRVTPYTESLEAEQDAKIKEELGK